MPSDAGIGASTRGRRCTGGGGAMKIAIVGTGVSGLVAAHLLHPPRDHRVQSDTRIGGHANTVDVEVDGRSVGVDTGFIVYDDRNYPGFRALLDRLGVATQPTEIAPASAIPARALVSRLQPQCDLRPAPQSCQSIVSASARRRHTLQPRGPPLVTGEAALERTRSAPRERRVRGPRRGVVGRFRTSRPVLAIIRAAIPRPIRRVDLVGGPGDLHALPRPHVRAFHGQPRAARTRGPARMAHRDRRFPTLR